MMRSSVAIILDNGAQWGLEVDDGSSQITLQSDTSITGEHTYNLPFITGWSGHKTFELVLNIVGGNGKYMRVKDIRISDQ